MLDLFVSQELNKLSLNNNFNQEEVNFYQSKIDQSLKMTSNLGTLKFQVKSKLGHYTISLKYQKSNQATRYKIYTIRR